ncbi:putative holin-like toxin [Bacillus dakarensis]|nr:putative holin-like toxin [Bacillus dakarensis]
MTIYEAINVAIGSNSLLIAVLSLCVMLFVTNQKK